MKLPVLITLFIISCYSITAQKLVLPGDFPDPSVVKIGDTYWASATTSNWLPAYPLLKSKDLVNWTITGNVFNTPPDWVDYYFWAPEISYDNGKVYIYYSAHKKNGNLCLGVASADKPEGPYTDHGPLMCQEAGSIDAFPMRDEQGKLYMIWKEDGNSVRKPTPIWAMEMNEGRTALTGSKKELFRNTADWEANLVEGVSMIRHGEYFYAFYAAAGCCGIGCTYNTGVARSKTLLGPWEKYEKNPVLTSNNAWKCPGHGTPVEKDGRFYFLYHGYNTESSVYTGRQGLLSEFRFTDDGWISFVNDEQPATVLAPYKENFRKTSLPPDWEWSVFQQPEYKTGGKKLQLSAGHAPSGSYLAQKNTSADYTVQVCADKESTAAAGLSLVGDERNMVTFFRKGDSLNLVQLRNNKDSLLQHIMLNKKSNVFLRMVVRNGKDISYFYSTNGRRYLPVNATPVNGAYLPPWDRAVRIGLVSKGNPSDKAVFRRFTYIPE